MLIQHLQQKLECACSLSKETLGVLSAGLPIEKWSGMGIDLTVFELGLFAKTRGMVEGRMQALLDLSLLLGVQTRLVLSLRESLKGLKRNLEKGPYVGLPEQNFSSFHVPICGDKRFEDYIRSGDWAQDIPAAIVAEQYTDILP